MIKDQLNNLFKKSKKDRHRFLGNHLDSNIAAQLYAMRDQRGWTQKNVADEAGIAQPRIPSYEDPSYGAYTLATLKKLAYGYDVALVVRFVPFDELADWIANLSPEDLAVLSYDQEKTDIPVSTTGVIDASTHGPSIKPDLPPQQASIHTEVGHAAEMARRGIGQSNYGPGGANADLMTTASFKAGIREPVLT